MICQIQKKTTLAMVALYGCSCVYAQRYWWSREIFFILKLYEILARIS